MEKVPAVLLYNFTWLRQCQLVKIETINFLFFFIAMNFIDFFLRRTFWTSDCAQWFDGISMGHDPSSKGCCFQTRKNFGYRDDRFFGTRRGAWTIAEQRNIRSCYERRRNGGSKIYRKLLNRTKLMFYFVACFRT